MDYGKIYIYILFLLNLFKVCIKFQFVQSCQTLTTFFYIPFVLTFAHVCDIWTVQRKCSYLCKASMGSESPWVNSLTNLIIPFPWYAKGQAKKKQVCFYLKLPWCGGSIPHSAFQPSTNFSHIPRHLLPTATWNLHLPRPLCPLPYICLSRQHFSQLP